MNDYYNTPAIPTEYTLARAEPIKQQFAAIAAGFDKLPVPEDLHENRIGFAEAEGTADALLVNLPVSPVGYVNGLTLKVGIVTNNTGAVTVDVNGLGIVPVVGRAANPLAAGDLVAGTVETMTYYGGKFIIREVSGAQGPQGIQGIPGPLDGSTILNGTAAPTTEGANGDFYVRTSNWTIYGPKTAGAWGSPTSLIGPAGNNGTNGSNGSNGADGADGNGILSGTGAPSGATGADGDFYVRTSDTTLYGPKTGGAWGSPISLIGPAGPTGPSGDWGALGSKPAALVALAGLAGAAGKIPYFTDTDENMSSGTLLEIFSALSPTDKGTIAGALGAIRVESMSLANPGYIRFLLPDSSHGILQWGSQNFNANGSTTVNYPCPEDYTTFSVAVVSSARPVTNAEDNAAGTTSCGLSSFTAFSAADVTLPGFWIAWGI